MCRVDTPKAKGCSTKSSALMRFMSIFGGRKMKIEIPKSEQFYGMVMAEWKK
jgi:hypothetical protein